MEDYIFKTDDEMPTNADTMFEFVEYHFLNVFEAGSSVTFDDGSYIEVVTPNGEMWEVRASGNGDFRNHKISFCLVED